MIKKAGLRGTLERAVKSMRGRWDLLLIFSIPLAWYILFQYVPLYGIQIAFRRFNPAAGIPGSPWVGGIYFKQFFDSYYFGELIRNTILLSLFQILMGFPLPIILALIINEIRFKKFRQFLQNVTYIPHFLSLVVVVSMLGLFSNTEYGLFNKIGMFFGNQAVDYMAKAEYFRPLYVFSTVWQMMGFNSVIYIAALSAIDPALYEAAIIDGASRWRKIIHISLPCLLPTIVILFILRIGHMMEVGFEKAYLMQNPVNMETSELISTFIYKNGIQKGQFSYSAAVGIFNNVINFILLVTANFISRKTVRTSLW